MRSLLSLLVLGLGTSAMAQNFDPPPAKTPDPATLKKIEEGIAKLKEAVATAVPKIREEHRADLEIYVKAAEWIVRHQEWHTADSGKQTLSVIDQGMKRAESAMDGTTPWLKPNGRAVARGYRSKVDGSVQPYGVIYPRGYGDDPKRKWRLDIFLHGRDSSLTEVKHLNQHAGREAPKEQDYVQLNIYGRGNNAYRWAGETDVDDVGNHFLAAEANLGREDTIDLRRVVLKGFSMGGAGAWHLGLRRPENFAVIQPGAGFTTTHGYIGKLPDPLPDYQEKCLRIYDAYLYAENAFNVPVVAYSGEKDKQKAAADLIEAELKKLKLSERVTHIVAPGLEHKFPPEWQAKVEDLVRLRIGKDGRTENPDHIRFVTYTLKQDLYEWVAIQGMGRHYERARVNAKRDGDTIRATTENITRIHFYPLWRPRPKSVILDGQEFVVRENGPAVSYAYVRTKDGWMPVQDGSPLARTGKRPRVQGPIDDAFTDRFLCVVGTGKPHHPEMHQAAIAQLDRFRGEWDKYMRGTLVVKKDTDLTEADRKDKNLILFGDAGSNSLIAKAMEKLPFQWTADSLDFGGKRYDPAIHLPMLIQPSPFDKDHYVVLNSGHTFHEADFKGTNALLYPRLGDFAVVKPTPNAKDPASFEVVTAGLFDEMWQFPKK